MCTCNRDLLSQCEESEAGDGIRQKQDCHLHLLFARAHEFGALRLRWHARSLFLGTTGVREDPATGSAAGPLCAYIAREIGVRALTIQQGVAIGR